MSEDHQEQINNCFFPLLEHWYTLNIIRLPKFTSLDCREGTALVVSNVTLKRHKAVWTNWTPPWKKKNKLQSYETLQDVQLWGGSYFSAEPASLRQGLHDKWSSSAYGLYFIFLWSCKECDSPGGNTVKIKEYRQRVRIGSGRKR